MCIVEIEGMSFDVTERNRRGEVPLLLINGMRMNQGVYGRLRGHLHAPTTTFDFPLFWWPSLMWLYSPMGDIAHKVSRLIDVLGYERVDLLGASWGGTLAIECASRYPDQIRNLVLVSTTARPLRNFLHPRMQLNYLRRDYGGKAGLDTALLGETKEEVGRSSVITDFYRGMALPFWDISVRLSSVQQRTLIVSGSDDPITPLSEAEWLLNIPHSELKLVDDGHLAVYTSANEVAHHINHFLEETTCH